MKSFRLPTQSTGIDGVVEERRNLLIATPAVMGALLASPRRLFAALDDAQASEQVEQFLEETAERALELKADDSASGQEAYLDYIVERSMTVANVPTDNLDDRSWFDMDPGVYLGVAGRNQAFFIVHWRFDPHAFLPAHCHPRTSVCTLTVEGSTVVRHFDVPADAPPYRTDHETEFLIHETRRVELAAGDTSTLSEHRDNIHLFEAGPDGARGIDVTTDYGGDGSFSFLEFDRNRPQDEKTRAFAARWIGRRLA